MARLNSIFNFLKDYNELSNPVITEIDKQRWSLKLSNLPQIKDVWCIYHVQDNKSNLILEVIRPVLEPCPSPAPIIYDWIEGKWNNLHVEHIQNKEKLIIEIELEDGAVTHTEEFFNEMSERVEFFDEWVVKRNNWRTIELPKQQGLDLYNNLFKLYSDIKKEAESVELLLGDGHIRWNTEERRIDHPVLLQKIQLEFNPDKPSFLLKCDELKTELYTPMLRVISSINQSMLSEAAQEIEENVYHIADVSNTKGFFQRLVSVLDEKGKWFESFEADYEGPMIVSEPILFLRKRTLGFSNLINEIIKDIEKSNGNSIPAFFRPMIGEYEDIEQREIIENNWNQSGMDEDILLTLPANNDQLKIVKYLNNYGAVLVQGPPGTGKTHTIANLIGHLLSEGKSVLVTSHTEKALTVLKEKVYKDDLGLYNLQALCISLLSSSSQKKEIDSSLFEIAEKGTSLDLSDSFKKISRLKEERKELITDYRNKQKELIQIRALEYKDIVYSNQTLKPIDAAKFIKTGDGKFDIIPGPAIDNTIALPVSIDELDALYQSNELISIEEELLLSKELPVLDVLWNVDGFKSRRDTYFQLFDAIKEGGQNLLFNEGIEETRLELLLNKANSVQNSLLDMDEFQLSLVSQSINDKLNINFWTLIFDELDLISTGYEEYRHVLFNNDIEIPKEIIANESLFMINEIIATGKNIPVSGINALTKHKWRKFRNSIFINKKTVESREDYNKVRIIIDYELKRKVIQNKINKLLQQVSENERIGIEHFETKIDQLRKKVLFSLNWYEGNWSVFIDEVRNVLVEEEKYDQVCVLDIEKPMYSMKKLLISVLLPEIVFKYNEVLLNKNAIIWDQYFSTLMTYKTYGSPFNGLVNAIQNKDIEMYDANYTAVLKIYQKNSIYLERVKTIEILKVHAPSWAKAISNRVGIHGHSSKSIYIEDAWKWLQLSNQIKTIDSYNPIIIQKELHKMSEDLLRNAQRLAYEKAWYEKIKNKTIEQTQAIEGWRQTLKQYGKGFVKEAPMLLRKIREYMPVCQSAIPVWVMPLNRVAENFDPQKNKFDVVIIDEASQADILALSALYLGKKVIIVGDDEQVSPDSVGVKTEEISALIEQHLHGVPNKHLFNGKTSVYDMAKASGFKPLMLTEHFRCLPEIIEFSNQLSYNGKIKPLRDASGVKIKPSVLEYRVPNAIRDNKINKTEALHIASVIAACIENEAYKNKTIGVISLLGQEQSYEIDRLLQANLDPKEYDKRRIQCGTASQFQGDERDVIFLSMVEAANEKGGPVRLVSEDGRNDMYRKRYNVAASRAKDQMWVVHSLNPEIDLKSDDIRLKLIKHAMNPEIEGINGRLSTTESGFERQVMQTLLNKGYQVTSQWKVGTYRIDMVIEDGIKKMALECDGDKWHSQDDLPNDLKRQAILERLGWKFIRIRGSAFYRDPDKTMEWVYEELRQNNINPNFIDSSKSDLNETDETNKLIDSLKRRAEQIRLEWSRSETEFTDVKGFTSRVKEGTLPTKKDMGKSVTANNNNDQNIDKSGANTLFVHNILTVPEPALIADHEPKLLIDSHVAAAAQSDDENRIFRIDSTIDMTQSMLNDQMPDHDQLSINSLEENQLAILEKSDVEIKGISDLSLENNQDHKTLKSKHVFDFRNNDIDKKSNKETGIVKYDKIQENKSEIQIPGSSAKTEDKKPKFDFRKNKV